MKSILFYWGKGAGIRVKILNSIQKRNKREKPCFLSEIARDVNLSHVAVKKHLDLLIEDSYIAALNPGGKPTYIELTNKGLEVLKEFKK